jgi:hypothetical protein
MGSSLAIAVLNLVTRQPIIKNNVSVNIRETDLGIRTEVFVAFQ